MNTLYINIHMYNHNNYEPSCPSVSWLVNRPVFHNYLKGRDATLPYSLLFTLQGVFPLGHSPLFSLRWRSRFTSSDSYL